MRRTLAWLLFWIGDALLRPMNRWDRASFLYPAYNRIMLLSSDIQGDGHGPWGPPERF